MKKKRKEKKQPEKIRLRIDWYQSELCFKYAISILYLVRVSLLNKYYKIKKILLLFDDLKFFLISYKDLLIKIYNNFNNYLFKREAIMTFSESNGVNLKLRSKKQNQTQ